ncbi:aminodeoxychorismate lyase [alpha proteobacterium U9-1i]|nr:aminodeoxychorismate lyase [alpha proteobacterium U9-1i]
MIVWRDGTWIADAQLDRGASLGDGLFETMLWRDGHAVRLERHVARMSASVAALHLPAIQLPTDIGALLAELVERNGLKDERAALNLRYAVQGARGLERDGVNAIFSARAGPAPAPRDTVTLASVAVRRNETAPSTRHKTLSYIDQIEARRQARALGAEEAAQLNMAGALAGAGAGNLILILGGRALTPPVRDGALPGTVRAALLECGLIEEATLTAADCAQASSAAVTNALFGVRAVTEWDRRTLAPHAAFAAMRKALED